MSIRGFSPSLFVLESCLIGSLGPASSAIAQEDEETATQESPSELGDEEVLRSLERNLIRQGGLVLQPKSFELEPQLEYSYRGRSGLDIVDDPSGALVTSVEQESSRLDASVSFRAGLPWGSQAQLLAPFSTVRTSRTFFGTEESGSESGIGDIVIAFTKQFGGNDGVAPRLLASLQSSLRTGDDDLQTIDSVQPRATLGSGFRTIQATLTAVQRRDPLVFFGSLSYATSQSEETSVGRLSPGDVVALKLGTFLAVSPGTSLRVALQVNGVEEAAVEERRLPGSDTVVGELEIGFSTVISSRSMVDVSGIIGITEDAPDFILRFSMPIRL